MTFLPSGIGPISPRNTGRPAQSQIGAAIVDADLRMPFQEGLLRVVITNAYLAVGPTGDNAISILWHAGYPTFSQRCLSVLRLQPPSTWCCSSSSVIYPGYRPAGRSAESNPATPDTAGAFARTDRFRIPATLATTCSLPTQARVMRRRLCGLRCTPEPLQVLLNQPALAVQDGFNVPKKAAPINGPLVTKATPICDSKRNLNTS